MVGKLVPTGRKFLDPFWINVGPGAENKHGDFDLMTVEYVENFSERLGAPLNVKADVNELGVGVAGVDFDGAGVATGPGAIYHAKW